METNTEEQLTDNFYKFDDRSSIRYRVLGNGKKTIIFLHGFGASLDTWENLTPNFNPDKYKLLLIDLIGAGKSSKTGIKDYSITKNAQIVCSLINYLKLTNYVLVGHSMGGSVALAISILNDNNGASKPSGLILLNPAAFVHSPPFFIRNLKTPFLNRLTIGLTSPEFRARYTLGKIYYDSKKVTDELVNRYAQYSSIPGHDDSLIKTASQLKPKEAKAFIKDYVNIRIKVLILSSKNDPVIKPRTQKKLAKAIPGSLLIEIPKCGHNIQEEQPELAIKHINHFLKKGVFE